MRFEAGRGSRNERWLDRTRSHDRPGGVAPARRSSSIANVEPSAREAGPRARHGTGFPSDVEAAVVAPAAVEAAVPAPVEAGTPAPAAEAAAPAEPAPPAEPAAPAAPPAEPAVPAAAPTESAAPAPGPAPAEAPAPASVATTASAVRRPTPGTSLTSSTVAALSLRTDPKCLSSAALRVAPRPGTASSADVVMFADRFCRW